MTDDQAGPEDSHLEEKRADVYRPWLEAARHCDYVGVPTYSRSIVARYASKATKVPIIVTEDGIAAEDDTRRVEYFQRALAGLKRAIDDGVRGYVAWALMDNFERMLGLTPKFGLVAVDVKTQKRTIKPSAAMLGNIARRNAL